MVVLVAEDDPGILESTKLLLEYQGYTVLTAVNESEVEKKKYDAKIILLDIRLAGANGEHIAKKLKSSDDTRNIPIIMFSANRDIEEIAERAGADDFLIKPFNLEELLDKLKKFGENAS